jgi:protein O-mannosyl-transferase
MAKKQKQPTQPPRQAQRPVQKSEPTTKKQAAIDQADGVGLSQYWPILGLLAATFAILSPMLGFDFVNWDDFVNIHDNESLRAFDGASIKRIFTDSVIGGYNPLTILTFAIEKHLFGLESAKIFHLDNLLLHLGVVFFVYRLSIELGLKVWYALAVAALFALHPMRIESVAWVTERKDVLYAFFFFGVLLQYTRYIKEDKAKPWRVAVMAVLAVLALLSKIQAVTLPLSMLCIDLILRREISIKLILEKWLFWALSLSVGLLGVYFLRNANTIVDADADVFSQGQRLLIGFSTLGTYLIKSVFPWAMSPLYPYPSKMLWYHFASPLVVLALGVWVYWAWKQGKTNTVAGLLFFLFNVMFVLQFVGAGQGYWADRFTYVAYFGLFFAGVAAISHIVETKPDLKMPLHVVLCVFTLVMAGLAYKQNFVWQDPVSLWTKAISYEPKTALPWTNRGQHYRDEANKLTDPKLVNQKREFYKLAEKDYLEALRLRPQAGTFNSVAKLYFDQQQPDKAIEYYEQAIKKDPKMSEAWVNLGAAYGMKSNYDEAKRCLTEGIKLDPENQNGYLNRGLMRFMTQDFEGAIQDDTKYLSLNPYRHEMNYEIAVCHSALKRYDQAIPFFNKAIAGKPELGVAYLERAKANFMLGNKATIAADVANAKKYGVAPGQIPGELLQ